MWKKKLGSVGVDSGQLLVIDPRYIESDWNENREEVKAIDFWGQGGEQVKSLLITNGCEVLSVGGKSRIEVGNNEEYFELDS